MDAMEGGVMDKLSFRDILQGVKERQAARVVGVALEEPPPEAVDATCPRCRGMGILTAGFDKSDSRNWVERYVPCPECPPPVPDGPDFDSFNCHPKWPTLEKAYNMALTWANGEGPGILLLAGDRGVGKTHLLRAAYKVVVASGVKCHWAKDGQLIDQMFRSFEEHDTDRWMRDITSVPALFIDELGGTSLSTDVIRSLYDRIIDARWEGSQYGTLRTMLTTNLHPSELPPRMRSRLLDNRLAVSLTIDAPDYRQK